MHLAIVCGKLPVAVFSVTRLQEKTCGSAKNGPDHTRWCGNAGLLEAIALLQQLAGDAQAEA